MNLHKSDRCPTCKRRIRRSTEANRRYWALLHAMAEKIHPAQQIFSADQWHLWARSKFLGCDDVKLPSGKVLTIPKSTADLDVAEFNAYMEQVEAFAAERGCFLADMEMA